MLHIEKDEDGGCYRLIDDGIGLCTSKSRNVLVRIRDALNAVHATGLVGVTVEYTKDTVPNRIVGYPRAVVLALSDAHLVVRKTDNMLDLWRVVECRIVEPACPEKDTPSNEPPIGVLTACELLQKWLEPCGHRGIAEATKEFLVARKRAEPTP